MSLMKKKMNWVGGFLFSFSRQTRLRQKFCNISFLNKHRIKLKRTKQSHSNHFYMILGTNLIAMPLEKRT